MTRALIIGGTFNPVHAGHLRLAIEAREALAFDRVEWIPCQMPRHKKADGLLPFSLRLALVRAATDSVAKTIVNDIESRLPSPSVTVQTLEALAETDPDAKRYFALGHQEFLRLPNWYRGRELPSLSHLVIAARADLDLDEFSKSVHSAWPDCRAIPAPQGTSAAYELMPGRTAVVLALPHLEISASLIRQRWVSGRDIAHLVPPAVLQLLEANRATVDAIWTQPAPPTTASLEA